MEGFQGYNMNPAFGFDAFGNTNMGFQATTPNQQQAFAFNANPQFSLAAPYGPPTFNSVDPNNLGRDAPPSFSFGFPAPQPFAITPMENAIHSQVDMQVDPQMVVPTPPVDVQMERGVPDPKNSFPIQQQLTVQPIAFPMQPTPIPTVPLTPFNMDPNIFAPTPQTKDNPVFMDPQNFMDLMTAPPEAFMPDPISLQQFNAPMTMEEAMNNTPDQGDPDQGDPGSTGFGPGAEGGGNEGGGGGNAGPGNTGTGTPGGQAVGGGAASTGENAEGGGGLGTGTGNPGGMATGGGATSDGGEGGATGGGPGPGDAGNDGGGTGV